MKERSGVGVLDRSVAVLEAVERGARTLHQIVETTRLSRPTAHRLLMALEAHEFVTRLGGQGFRLGPRLLRFAEVAMRELPIRDLAHPALERLARVTGESAQLYVRSGDERVCIDAVESASELRTIVPIGASLPLVAGSAGKVFLAWDRSAGRLVEGAADSDALRRQLRMVRARGWAMSSGEREPGVASVSAPVLERGRVLAAVSVSGPANRLGRFRAKQYASAVLETAREIERSLGVG